MSVDAQCTLSLCTTSGWIELPLLRAGADVDAGVDDHIGMRAGLMYLFSRGQQRIEHRLG